MRFLQQQIFFPRSHAFSVESRKRGTPLLECRSAVGGSTPDERTPVPQNQTAELLALLTRALSQDTTVFYPSELF